MDKFKLEELNMKTRNEDLVFLKRLWDQEKTYYPICNEENEKIPN